MSGRLVVNRTPTPPFGPHPQQGSSRRALPQVDPLLNLHRRLEARRAELEQATLARINAVADPSQVRDPAYVTGLRSAHIAALDYGLSAIAAPQRQPDPVPVELLAQARLATRHQVPLEAVLRRYSAGHTLLADGMLEEAAALGLRAPELQSAFRALNARYDRIVATVSEEYERQGRTEQPSAERRRCTLLQRLLGGEPIDTSAFDYRFDLHHVALLGAGEAASQAIVRFCQGLDRRLLLVEPDAQLAWAWIGGRRRFACEELDLIATYPWPTGCAFACGEPGQGLAGWRLSHRQATAALPVASRERNSLVRYSDVALIASAMQDDLLITSLRHAYLAPLEAERDGGAASKATLRAYFAAATNVSSAAAALGLNRRTVASRLAAIEKRLGHSLVAIATELEIALRLDLVEQTSRGESLEESSLAD
jgi:hypothetical protein